MSIWKKLFPGSPATAAVTPDQPAFDRVIALIMKLQSPNDHEFESGLNEAVALTRRRDATGLEAINNAIIGLSGDEHFTPYKPGAVMASATDYANAQDELLELAKRKEFLKNPHKTQQLISAFKFLNNAQDFTKLIDDVYRVGGSSEAHALLLLTNEMWCSVQLR